MLQPNILNPPRPFPEPSGAGSMCPSREGESLFVSPEDFDATGILTGFDPSASAFWWIPELHTAGPIELAVVTSPTLHAARRTSVRSQAAA